MNALTKKLTTTDALVLAQAFREASKALGDYLYTNWTTLPSSERDTLRSLEVTLLNLATDLVTQAVGIVLDDGQGSLQSLSNATKVATNTIEKINSVRKVIKIATALIGLAAAIPTGNPQSIYSAFNAVIDSVEGKGSTKDKKAD